jgi:hypothetical protein
VGLALLGGTVLVVLLILVDWTAELLWFRALGYGDVFWRLLFADVAMFAIAFIPVFVYMLLNLLVLARLADLQSLLRGRGPAGIPQSWQNHSRTGVAQPNAPGNPTSPSWVGCNSHNFGLCSPPSGIGSARFGPRISGPLIHLLSRHWLPVRLPFLNHSVSLVLST